MGSNFRIIFATCIFDGLLNDDAFDLAVVYSDLVSSLILAWSFNYDILYLPYLYRFLPVLSFDIQKMVVDALDKICDYVKEKIQEEIDQLQF